METLDLSTLEAFLPTGANWKLASEVASNRTERHSLVVTEGTGILVNTPSQEARANILTQWAHQDLELELEFMMPRGSNSGIYLQGRYEIQLLDSWRKVNPTFGDVGGIYERWNEAEQRDFGGHPPRVNASRAPGLWQKLHLIFRAPRFDAEGRKIAPASFESVSLNGSLLHQNVTITGPTRAATFNFEAAMGPLMIQGDHGPVALRNIRYKHYSATPVHTTEVSYRMFVGDYTEIPTDTPPTAEGQIQALADHRIAEAQPLLAQYQGQLFLPASGTHRFSVSLGWITGDPHFRDARIGGAVLMIGDKEILRHDTNATTVSHEVILERGHHPFSFTFHKTIRSRPPDLTLMVEGPSTPAIALIQPPQRNQPAPLIPVSVGSMPTVLRGFVVHGGAKRTHAVSVGTPSGVHYSIDLAQGYLLHAWRGPFLDATAMWHNRGHDQTAKPLGSILTLPNLPLIGEQAEALKTLGYRIDSAGLPIFRYALGGITIEDQITPAENGPYLWRTLSFEIDTVQSETLWVQAATGMLIRTAQEGRLLIVNDPHSFYIETPGDYEVHSTDAGVTVLLPVYFKDGVATVTYAIVW